MANMALKLIVAIASAAVLYIGVRACITVLNAPFAADLSTTARLVLAFVATLAICPLIILPWWALFRIPGVRTATQSSTLFYAWILFLIVCAYVPGLRYAHLNKQPAAGGKSRKSIDP
jgi:uncharacterized membrane protein YdfJ with MMPL/SSD domain